MKLRPRSGVLTTQGAAELAGISVRHLRRLLAAKKIDPPVKTEEGSLKWTAADIEDLKAAITRRRRTAA